MITAQSISHHYGDRYQLTFKDWNISKGEQWLLLGDSGSGKTTLLHIITGILKPSTGHVIISDTNLYQLPSRKLDHFRGKNIGMIFQRPHLIKSLTVFENLLITQSFAGLPENRQRINEVLHSLNIAKKKENYPAELSQGQLQRVSIARAVLNKPVLIIADEPTSSLDDKNTAAVIKLLISQSLENDSTLVVATHDKRVKDMLSKEYQV